MSGACRAGVRMGTTMRMTMLSMAAALAWSTLATAQNATPVNARAEHRVAALLEQMTLEEKIDLLGGVNAFDVRGVPRLGLPLMATADGPFGIRRYTRANIVAGGIALAATWNTELARSVGEEMGRD